MGLTIRRKGPKCSRKTHQLTDAGKHPSPILRKYNSPCSDQKIAKILNSLCEDLLTDSLLYHTLTFQPPQSFDFVDVKLSARKKLAKRRTSTYYYLNWLEMHMSDAYVKGSSSAILKVYLVSHLAPKKYLRWAKTRHVRINCINKVPQKRLIRQSRWSWQNLSSITLNRWVWNWYKTRNRCQARCLVWKEFPLSTS